MCQALCWAPIPGALWCPPGSGSRPRPRAFLERKGQGQLSSGGRKNMGLSGAPRGSRRAPPRAVVSGDLQRLPGRSSWGGRKEGWRGRGGAYCHRGLSSRGLLPTGPRCPVPALPPPESPSGCSVLALLEPILLYLRKEGLDICCGGGHGSTALGGRLGPEGHRVCHKLLAGGGRGWEAGGAESYQVSGVNPFPVPAVGRPGDRGWGYPEDCGLGHVYSHLLGKHQAAPRTSWRG